jgi:hypothetical protein
MDARPVTATAETGATAGGAKRWIRAHRVGIAYGLVGLACLLTLVVSMSVWVNRQLLDTDTWVDQSAKMLQNEDVRHALALRLVDAAYSQGDVENRLEQRLPDQLQGLAPTIAGALRPAAVDAAEALLERPRVQSLWEDANRLAHTKLVAVLEGNEGGAITTAGGDVVLNVGQIVSQLRQELGITGTQRVPEEASITIMHSDDLEAAQTYVRVIKVVSVFASILVVALLVLAIWLAEGRRREVVRAAAWGLLAVGLILLVVRRLAGNAVVDAIAAPEGESAARTVWILSTSIMRDLGLELIAIGLVALLWALVAGRTRVGTWLRNLVAPTLRERPALAFGAVFVAFVLLLLWGPIGAPRALLGTVVILAAALAGVEALRRQVLAEGGTVDRPATPAAV